MPRLGTGIGWRPEIADTVEAMPGIDWVEVVAENVCPGHLPESLLRLRERGVTVIPHGVSLGLGGAERPGPGRLAGLAEQVAALGAPLVTEHIAFVRAGGALTASPHLEAGHLLPVPRTRDALAVLCENVRIAQDALPVPLALENIAALFSWPGEELTEGQFLSELVERTGVRLLVDVANLHTNHVNRGEDPVAALAALPLEAIAYVHVAGGFERDGVWHDSHAHPVPRPVLDILADLASRVAPPGVLLERDDDFPGPAELQRELDVVREAVAAGATRSTGRGTPDKPEARITGGDPTVDGGRMGGSGPAVASTATAADGSRAGSGDPAVTSTATTADGPAAAVTGTVPVVASTATTADGARVGGGGPAVDGGRVGSGAPAVASAATTADGPAAAADSPAAAVTGTVPAAAVTGTVPAGDGVRQRLGVAQAAVLSALVAGTPVPEGFDRARMGVQARALAAKRAGVVAQVAPELPVILGDGYRAAFLAYARSLPMSGGYRRDALDFAGHLLKLGRPDDPGTRRELREWWLHRAGPAPRPRGLAARARVLLRRS
ncbi:multinuclear nonheme iron-dependent oxidase [Streptomyces sp. DSM 118148]|uniref:multinuclear nonheme iron-dependent oxidase n=1 Tax=Streptomyces sp. DSM 118148 TaxID=3448667 RepID=UPI0040402BB4